jgi:hypothetical protein
VFRRARNTLEHSDRHVGLEIAALEAGVVTGLARHFLGHDNRGFVQALVGNAEVADPDLNRVQFVGVKRIDFGKTFLPRQIVRRG